MIFALSSCNIDFYWIIEDTPPTQTKNIYNIVLGAGPSKDGTLLTKSNFYLSHLKKLTSFCGALQTQLSA